MAAIAHHWFGRPLQERRSDALERLEKLVSLMDDAVELPLIGTRIGLDPFLNLIPGVKDTVPLAIGMFTLFEAFRLKAPPALILKMFGRYVLDALLGAIPILGTLFDLHYRAYRRNLDELVAFLAETGA